MPGMEHKPELRQNRVEPASRNHQRSRLFCPLVVPGLRPLDELGLTCDIEVVGSGLDAGGDDGIAVEVERADAVEDDPGAAT